MYEKNNVDSNNQELQKFDGSIAAENDDTFSNVDTFKNAPKENVKIVK